MIPRSRSVGPGAARARAHVRGVPFVFNRATYLAPPAPGGSCEFDEVERGLAGAMADAWTRMAAAGRPGR